MEGALLQIQTLEAENILIAKDVQEKKILAAKLEKELEELETKNVALQEENIQLQNKLDISLCNHRQEGLVSDMIKNLLVEKQDAIIATQQTLKYKQMEVCKNRIQFCGQTDVVIETSSQVECSQTIETETDVEMLTEAEAKPASMTETELHKPE